MMKRIVTISLILFWTAYVVIVAVGMTKHLDSLKSSKTSTPAPVVDTKALGQITLDAAEVAKHSTESSCWLIISGKVYDISTYFGSHPGGNSYLAAYCGKDATNAFDVSPHAHSSYANSLLAKYLLGNLGEAINVPVTAPSPTITKPPTNTGSVPAAGTPVKSGVTYTKVDVATHNSASSCWLIVGGNVYNVSSFIASNTHRAGNGVIIPLCGQDVTNQFGVHTSAGYSVLSSYYIGTVGASTTGTGAATAPPTGGTTPPTTPTSGNDD